MGLEMKQMKAGTVARHRIFFKRTFLLPIERELSKVGGRVLDVGCGNGILTRTLYESAPQLEFWGIDKSKRQIAKAKSYAAHIHYKVANAEKLPFAANYFNAVVCFEVLEHVDSIAKVMGEVNRVLKKGGIFYLTTPLEGDTKNLYGMLNKFYGFDPHNKLFGHINKNTLGTLENILAANGFVIQKRTFCSHYVNQIYMLVTHYFQSKTRRLDRILGPFNIAMSLVSSVESLVLQKAPFGLDVQILAKKK